MSAASRAHFRHDSTGSQYQASSDSNSTSLMPQSPCGKSVTSRGKQASAPGSPAIGQLCEKGTSCLHSSRRPQRRANSRILSSRGIGQANESGQQLRPGNDPLEGIRSRANIVEPSIPKPDLARRAKATSGQGPVQSILLICKPSLDPLERRPPADCHIKRHSLQRAGHPAVG
jgi:hypothetical protein